MNDHGFDKLVSGRARAERPRIQPEIENRLARTLQNPVERKKSIPHKTKRRWQAPVLAGMLTLCAVLAVAWMVPPRDAQRGTNEGDDPAIVIAPSAQVQFLDYAEITHADLQLRYSMTFQNPLDEPVKVEWEALYDNNEAQPITPRSIISDVLTFIGILEKQQEPYITVVQPEGSLILAPGESVTDTFIQLLSRPCNERMGYRYTAWREDARSASGWTLLGRDEQYRTLKHSSSFHDGASSGMEACLTYQGEGYNVRLLRFETFQEAAYAAIDIVFDSVEAYELFKASEAEQASYELKVDGTTLQRYVHTTYTYDGSDGRPPVYTYLFWQRGSIGDGQLVSALLVAPGEAGEQADYRLSWYAGGDTEIQQPQVEQNVQIP